MQSIYIPGDAATNEFGRLLTTSNPEQFYRNYRYDVSPVDDNRPFFFYTVQPRDLLNFLIETRRRAPTIKSIGLFRCCSG